MAAAAAVAIAVALAVVVCYVAVSYRLHSELNSELKAEGTFDVSAAQAESGGMPHVKNYQAYKGGPSPYREVVFTSGQSFAVEGSSALPASAEAIRVAAGSAGSYFRDVTFNGTEVCIYTVHYGTLNGTGVALELGRPLTQSNSLLHELRLILLVVFLFAVPLAAIFGRFAARRGAASAGGGDRHRGHDRADRRSLPAHRGPRG